MNLFTVIDVGLCTASMSNWSNCALQQWVIQVSTSDEFHELQESGQSPEKRAATLAMKCSPHLTFEVQELVCIDEVDETSGTLSGTKAAEQSKKLNHDCNMTAGLEPSFLWLLLHESCCVATLTQTQAQMSEFVTELCHHRHLWSSFQLPEWPISTIQGSKSSMVSVVCLKEVNWLRDTYRKDLPLYVVLPLEPKGATKRKLAGTTHPDQSKAKKGISNSKTEKAPSPVRRHPLGNF